MKVICLIQARMGSSRLPGKVMKIINGKPVIEHILNSLKESNLIGKTIVATTNKKKDDALVDFLKKKRYLYFRGSEDDVLKRFVVGAQKEKPNLIVRITADCPLVDAKIVDTVIKRAIESNAEYTSNTLKLTYPDGYDVEVVKYSILKKVARLTHNKQDREHVTRYIRHNVEKFDTQNVEAPKDMQYSKWRLCLDTQKDFELIKKIFSFFPHHYIIHYEDVVTLFNKHKELQTLNQ